MPPTAEESKWKIPYGITFDKLSKVIQLLLRKNGDKTQLNIDSLITVSGLAKNFLSSNLTFLNSIKIIEGDNTGFKLTQLGADFARALSLDNEEDIKKLSLEIITKSHLDDLKVLVENEGDSITKDKMLKLIKTNAKLSGDNISQIPATSKSGAISLLTWFNKIGLTSIELVTIQHESKEKIPSRRKKKVKDTPTAIHDSNKTGVDNFVSKTEKFSIIIDKSIVLDELELAKKQTDMLFEHAKKKIESKEDKSE